MWALSCIICHYVKRWSTDWIKCGRTRVDGDERFERPTTPKITDNIEKTSMKRYLNTEESKQETSKGSKHINKHLKNACIIEWRIGYEKVYCALGVANAHFGSKARSKEHLQAISTKREGLLVSIHNRKWNLNRLLLLLHYWEEETVESVDCKKGMCFKEGEDSSFGREVNVNCQNMCSLTILKREKITWEYYVLLLYKLKTKRHHFKRKKTTHRLRFCDGEVWEGCL